MPRERLQPDLTQQCWDVSWPECSSYGALCLCPAWLVYVGFCKAHMALQCCGSARVPCTAPRDTALHLSPLPACSAGGTAVVDFTSVAQPRWLSCGHTGSTATQIQTHLTPAQILCRPWDCVQSSVLIPGPRVCIVPSGFVSWPSPSIPVAGP